MPRDKSASGFTALELMIGLVIFAMVSLAVAAFAMAAGAGWRSAQAAQSLSLVGNQTILRIQQVLRGARQINLNPGSYYPGSLDGSGSAAAIIVWKGDANNDGKIQLGELALLKHDRSHGGRIVWLEGTPSMTGDVTAWYPTMKPQDLEASLSSATPVVLVGWARSFPGNTLAPGMIGAGGVIFSPVGPSGTQERTRLDIQVQLQRDTLTLLQQGSVTLRRGS